MSELRAPDPTLDALAPDSSVITDERLRPIAHRSADCDPNAIVYQNAAHARWFAVPCRTCFPDAPEPGHVDRRQSCCQEFPSSGRLYWPDPHLSWQTGGDV